MGTLDEAGAVSVMLWRLLIHGGLKHTIAFVPYLRKCLSMLPRSELLHFAIDHSVGDWYFSVHPIIIIILSPIITLYTISHYHPIHHPTLIAHPHPPHIEQLLVNYVPSPLHLAHFLPGLVTNTMPLPLHPGQSLVNFLPSPPHCPHCCWHVAEVYILGCCLNKKPHPPQIWQTFVKSLPEPLHLWQCWGGLGTITTPDPQHPGQLSVKYLPDPLHRRQFCVTKPPWFQPGLNPWLPWLNPPLNPELNPPLLNPPNIYLIKYLNCYYSYRSHIFHNHVSNPFNSKIIISHSLIRNIC